MTNYDTLNVCHMHVDFLLFDNHMLTIDFTIIIYSHVITIDRYLI